MLCGFAIVARTPGLRMGIGSCSRLLKGVGKLAMPDARLDTVQHVESVCEGPRCAGVQRLSIPSMAVGVITDHPCVVDTVTGTR